MALFPNSAIEFHPFGRVDYTWVHRNAAQEEGASSLNLQLDAHNAQFLRGEVGLDLFSCYRRGEKVFLPRAEVAYVFEKRWGGSTSAANFLFSPGCLMNVVGMEPARSLLTYSLGFDVRASSDRFLFGIEWEGENGHAFWSSNFTGRILFAF